MVPALLHLQFSEKFALNLVIYFTFTALKLISDVNTLRREYSVTEDGPNI